jgi:hypothetical protein
MFKQARMPKMNDIDCRLRVVLITGAVCFVLRIHAFHHGNRAGSYGSGPLKSAVFGVKLGQSVLLM